MVKYPASPFSTRYQLDESLTVFEFVPTVQQIFADASRVLPGAQRLFDALDHTAQIMQGLQDLRALVWQVHLRVLETLVQYNEERK